MLNRHQLKIKDFGPKDKSELGVRILAWSKLLGLTEKPDREDTEYAVDFLEKHYTDFSVPEISYALELNLTGALGTKVESFQRINVPYLTKILNAYRVYRKRQVALDAQKKKQEEEEELRKPLSPEEVKKRQQDNYEGILKICTERGQIPSVWGWVDTYHHIKANKLLKMSYSEMEMFMENVRADEMERLEREKLKMGLHNFTRALEDMAGEGFKTLCQIAYVKWHFGQVIKELTPPAGG